MKLVSVISLASIAVLMTGGSALGQFQQASHSNGYCNNGQCDNGGYVGYQASNWNNCQSGCRCGKCWSTKAFPDSGWAPPLHYPVNYDGVWYGSYHPQAYYGNPGGGFIGNYPTVYQPNDTTQMGYTYAKVPTWQTRRDMIPPVPVPGNFHARGCLTGGHGCLDCRQHGASGSCPQCNSGQVVNDQYAFNHGAPVYPSPNGTQVVRPSTQKQSFFGKLKLASITELFD